MTKVAHDAGTALAVIFVPCGMGVNTDGTPPVSTGKLDKEKNMSIQECIRNKDAHAVVGCTNSTWLVSAAGIEKERVRMACSPVAWWVKTEKSAANSSLACATEIEKPRMSPAGEIGEVAKPLADRNCFTTVVVSDEGETNAST